MSSPMKSCQTCRFSSAERPQAGMIQPVWMCRHSPPVPVMVPIEVKIGKNERGEAVLIHNMQIRATHPAVSPTDWCHQHEPLPIDVS